LSATALPAKTNLDKRVLELTVDTNATKYTPPVPMTCPFF